MKPILILGIVLIVAGVALLALRGIAGVTLLVPYVKEHRAEIGPLKLKADEERTYPVAPMISALILAGGVVLVVVGLKK